jgi:hypothetical protein
MENLIDPTHGQRVVKTMLTQGIFKSKPINTLSLPKMGEERLGYGFDGEILVNIGRQLGELRRRAARQDLMQ